MVAPVAAARPAAVTKPPPVIQPVPTATHSNVKLQWSNQQGGLSSRAGIKSGNCFPLPVGFAPSPAAKAAGLNEC